MVSLYKLTLQLIEVMAMLVWTTNFTGENFERDRHWPSVQLCNTFFQVARAFSPDLRVWVEPLESTKYPRCQDVSYPQYGIWLMEYGKSPRQSLAAAGHHRSQRPIRTKGGYTESGLEELIHHGCLST